MENIVRCHSGYQYADKPKSFYWQNEWVEISEIRARWNTPHGNNFRVMTSDKLIFDLCYDEEKDSWVITPQ